MEDENQAGDSLAAPGADTGGSNMVTVPMDMLPGCKPGDTYKVTSVDGGNVVMEHMAMASSEMGDGEGDEKWGSDLAKAAPSEYQ